MKGNGESRSGSFIRIDPGALRLERLELDPAMFQSPLPVQNYHLVFADEAIGMAVGVWDTTTMQEAFGPYPGDEFITVLEGAFAIVDGKGGAVRGGAGQSACFRNAIPVSWKQDGYLKKVYLTLLDPEGEQPEIASAEGGVRVLDPAQTQAGGAAREVLFRNDAGTMTVTECRWPATDAALAPQPAHSLVRVLEGEIALADATGRRERFGVGDHVFVPRGVPCAWAAAEGTVTWQVDVTAA